MSKTPIQFQHHDDEAARLEKLKRLSSQVTDLSARDTEIAALRHDIAALTARVAALESP